MDRHCTVVLNDLGSDRQLARLFFKFHVSDVSSVSNYRSNLKPIR